jgi:hypothetical protein
VALPGPAHWCGGERILNKEQGILNDELVVSVLHSLMVIPCLPAGIGRFIIQNKISNKEQGMTNDELAVSVLHSLMVIPCLPAGIGRFIIQNKISNKEQGIMNDEVLFPFCIL